MSPRKRNPDLEATLADDDPLDPLDEDISVIDRMIESIEGTRRQLVGIDGLRFSAGVDYTVLRELRRDARAISYLAERDTGGVREHVALHALADLLPGSGDQLVRRATALSRLRHQNVIRTHGIVELPLDDVPDALRQALAAQLGAENVTCVVTDYVEGSDLRELQRSHLAAGLLLPVMLGAYIVSRVVRALEGVHSRLVHGDVGDGNVVIDGQGVPMLAAGGALIGGPVDLGLGLAERLPYLAPELLRAARKGDDAEPTERSDIYAAGLLAIELASGLILQAAPADGSAREQLDSVLRRVDHGFPRLDDMCPEVPETYGDIVARMTSPDPAKRPTKAGAIADEIEQHVLYATGFGPTYSSLAAYIEAFDNNFMRVDANAQTQLSFLRGDDGALWLRRSLGARMTFSEVGRAWVDKFKGSDLRAAVFESGDELPAHEAKGRALLKINHGDNCLETIALLPKRSVVIGRQMDTCDVVLIDRVSSRRHAQLDIDGDGSIKITDLGSGNGTFVGGKRIPPDTPTPIGVGVPLRVGNSALLFVHEPAIEPPPDAMDSLPTSGAPTKLAEQRELAFRLFSRNRGRLHKLLEAIGQRARLAPDRAASLALAVLEAISLTAEEQRSVTVHLLRERTRLRIHIHAPEGSAYLRKTLTMLKALMLGQQVDMSTRKAGVEIIRHAFDRLDFYITDHLLVLSKSF